MKRSFLYLCFPLLSACSWVGHVAKESALSATSFHGLDSFHLTGEVPANFTFIGKAQYAPSEGESCETYSPGLGGQVQRRFQHAYRSDAQPESHTFRFRVPLDYYMPGCSMELTGIHYELEATYGTDSWDHGRDNAGGLSVRRTLPSVVPTFPDSGVKEYRGLCTWLFQISTATAKKGEIEKLLSCHAADENWQIGEDRFARRKPGAAVRRGEVKGNEVRIVFRLSAEERPAYYGTWTKTQKGWRPCDGGWGTSRAEPCPEPPVFKTYKQGDRICTVYPRCTEK